jgi:hypothetical protein
MLCIPTKSDLVIICPVVSKIKSDLAIICPVISNIKSDLVIICPVDSKMKSDLVICPVVSKIKLDLVIICLVVSKIKFKDRRTDIIPPLVCEYILTLRYKQDFYNGLCCELCEIKILNLPY